MCVCMIIVSPYLLRQWLRLNGDEWPYQLCKAAQVRTHMQTGKSIWEWGNWGEQLYLKEAYD